ncbi:hypothetical protein Ana3638_18465 [Anaerocolumna sedimenticola]|uniref:Uncharacterized protein n=1 Tax=Anaerocolumna sedimenticola TaxID=2696063 RepID=A0A6P1TPX4_9FIRM|nr:SGNH/GDSL hydrolase family protein [Anaerocolumna sedimenticola]QHQ62523.1 hypothetical protein Ana3638_18465 [Anaerocolumna sedimenticola]
MGINMICILDKNYFRFSGRILEKNGAPCLGFTNSMVEFYIKSTGKTFVKANIGTNKTDVIDRARLKVFIDDSKEASNLIVLEQEMDSEFTLATFADEKIHKITLIKITEASKSYAKINDIFVNGGELIPFQEKEDNRSKIEFIGDSITCGYGVYGAPDAEYDIKDEDGTVAYAYLAAKELNLNARYFSVSGFGVLLKWDGDPEGNIPKVYPYTNYFFNKNEKYDFSEFIPDLLVINLGTNDSTHLVKEEVQKGFISNYIGLLKFIKSYAPDSKILCICGTMCTNAFPFIEKAVEQAKKEGLTDLYTMEQPYHDILRDGMAGGHPSLITHQKSAKQLVSKLKEIMR